MCKTYDVTDWPQSLGLQITHLNRLHWTDYLNNKRRFACIHCWGFQQVHLFFDHHGDRWGNERFENRRDGKFQLLELNNIWYYLQYTCRLVIVDKTIMPVNYYNCIYVTSPCLQHANLPSISYELVWSTDLPIREACGKFSATNQFHNADVSQVSSA